MKVNEGTDPGLWRAASAAVVITPTEPMWLAGWAARRQPASGKALDLFAKALAFQDPCGERAVIITADLIAIPRQSALAVAARVQAQCGLPRERLLFNASHNHCGPEVRPDKVPFFDIPPEFAARIPPYVSELDDKLVGLISAVLEDLRPARLVARQARVEFAKNRRSPSGPVDWTVPILEVTASNGKPLALVFGYACHNLTLPPSFCQYHGDFSGIAAKNIEAAFPGTTALFLAGAGADQDPEPRGTLELAELHGQTLAEAVQCALTQRGRSITGALGVAFEEVPLDFVPLPSLAALRADSAVDDPPRARKARFLMIALEKGERPPSSYPCPVQVLRFGHELLLIALGGEPVVDYALQFQTEFTGPLVFVAGYSNDGFGYLPNRRVLREGGYEGGRSLYWSALPAPFAETTEECVLAAVRRLAGRTGLVEQNGNQG